MQPTNSINPINPTNPTNSTNPINPTNPTNPTNSINPTNPTDSPLKPLTPAQKEKIVSRIFWDMDKNRFDWRGLLDERPPDLENPEARILYRRLLMSCDWYTLLKLMPSSKIKAVINSPIVDTLFPKDIQNRLKYARDVLSQTTVSISR